MSQELQIEGFAAWLMAAQLSLASLSSSPIPDALTKLTQVGVPKVDQINIVLVDKDKKPRQVSDNAEGFHFLEDDKVYVATWSEVYKSAESGNYQAKLKLASIIAHEWAHVRGGGEKEAYTAQITTLRKLKAADTMIQGVEQAMKKVVK